MDLDQISWSGSDDLTSFLTKKETMKVASVDKLKGFTRIGKNLLVREADDAFWSINENDDGSYTIERIVGEGEDESL